MKGRGRTAVPALLVLAVAVPLNLIFERMNFNLDMTPQGLYSLTKTTEDYLDQLDEQDVLIEMYYLNDYELLKKDTTVLDLYETLEAYGRHKSITMPAFDPETEPQLGKKLNPNNVYNLKKNDIFLKYENNVKRVQGGGIYLQETAQNADGSFSVVSEQFRAETLLTGAIKTVVEGTQPVVYFLEGHGENPVSKYSKLTPNLQNFNYGIKTLNLMNADAVPDDACIIVAAGPTEDISEAEYEKLTSFTEKGGNIMLLMTPNEKEFSYKNITHLMSDFCLDMDYNRIHESDTARHKSGDPFTFMCEIMPAAEDSSYNITGDLISGETQSLLCYMPASRSFRSIYASNFATCHIDTLIQTDVSAVAEPYGGSTLDDPQKKEGEHLTLAMYSENTLRENSKLAVFGSAEFLTDENTESSFFILPTYLFSAVLTWMYDSDANVMNIGTKERTFDTIRIASDAEAKTVIAIYVIFPLLVAAAGVIIWLRRKDA